MVRHEASEPLFAERPQVEGSVELVEPGLAKDRRVPHVMQVRGRDEHGAVILREDLRDLPSALSDRLHVAPPAAERSQEASRLFGRPPFLSPGHSPMLPASRAFARDVFEAHETSRRVRRRRSPVLVPRLEFVSIGRRSAR